MGRGATSHLPRNTLMKIKIKPTKTASKRTKERIAQHGPTFWWEEKAVEARRGEWLFKAGSGWFGWLPLNEFEID